MQVQGRESGAIVPFDYGREINATQRNLPHWQQDQVTYFVTFRLADSIPAFKIHEWHNQRDAWLMNHKQPFSSTEWREYNALFANKVNAMLDGGSGSCILKDPAIRRIVSDSLQFFDGERYLLGAWVVMPNHVHLIVTPFNGHSLSRITQSWKSYSAKKINQLLNQSGSVWQIESYDHIIRNHKQLVAITDYILKNPIKATLSSSQYSVSEM